MSSGRQPAVVYERVTLKLGEMLETLCQSLPTPVRSLSKMGTHLVSYPPPPLHLPPHLRRARRHQHIDFPHDNQFQPSQPSQPPRNCPPSSRHRHQQRPASINLRARLGPMAASACRPRSLPSTRTPAQTLSRQRQRPRCPPARIQRCLGSLAARSRLDSCPRRLHRPLNPKSILQ